MIPVIPNNEGYVVGPNGEQLRTPLQQIEKNKNDITEAKVDSLVAVNKVNNLERRVDALENDKVDRPDVPSENATEYYLVAINKDGTTIAKPYSNQAAGNAIVQRTGGGGAKFIAQYGNAQNVANLAALQMAQSMAYIDSYSGSTTSHKYKPYVFAAKGWGYGSGVTNAEITDFPNAVGDEWYQKICNGAAVEKTIILRSALMTNASRKRTNECVQKFTTNVNYGNQEWEPGLHDLTITIAPYSTIEIRCRYQGTAYSQIWIQ